MSASTPYIVIYHPLLTSIHQELGKLANSLAARVKEVGFFKHSQKYTGPHNCI